MENTQIVFSLISSVAGKDTERRRKTHLINTWLRGCCHRKNLFYFLSGWFIWHQPAHNRWGSPWSMGGKNSGLGVIRAQRKGFKLSLNIKGDKTRLARDELMSSNSGS